MMFSTPGLIGAAVGLLAALVAYVAMSATLERDRRALDPTQPSEERVERARKASVVRMILLADFPILGAVGYYVGQLLGRT